jgi:hypothetical protein
LWASKQFSWNKWRINKYINEHNIYIQDTP